MSDKFLAVRAASLDCIEAVFDFQEVFLAWKPEWHRCLQQHKKISFERVEFRDWYEMQDLESRLASEIAETDAETIVVHLPDKSGACKVESFFPPEKPPAWSEIRHFVDAANVYRDNVATAATLLEESARDVSDDLILLRSEKGFGDVKAWGRRFLTGCEAAAGLAAEILQVGGLNSVKRPKGGRAAETNQDNVWSCGDWFLEVQRILDLASPDAEHVANEICRETAATESEHRSGSQGEQDSPDGSQGKRGRNTEIAKHRQWFEEYDEGLSTQAQIARRLGVDPSTISKGIRNAKRELNRGD